MLCNLSRVSVIVVSLMIGQLVSAQTPVSTIWEVDRVDLGSQRMPGKRIYLIKLNAAGERTSIIAEMYPIDIDYKVTLDGKKAELSDIKPRDRVVFEWNAARSKIATLNASSKEAWEKAAREAQLKAGEWKYKQRVGDMEADKRAIEDDFNNWKMDAREALYRGGVAVGRATNLGKGTTQDAVFVARNGVVSNATIHHLGANLSVNKFQGKFYRYKTEDFRSVVYGDTYLSYDHAAKVFANVPQATVENLTKDRLTFKLNAAMNPEHRIIPLIEEDRPRTNLEELITTMCLVSELATNRPNKMPSFEWVIEPGQTLNLTVGPKMLKTLYAKYTVINPHGSVTNTVQAPAPGKGVNIRLTEKDVHGPVLVRMGEWNVDQEATRSKKVTVRGDDTIIEEVVKYSPIATATNHVENPTNQTLDVAITLEFRLDSLAGPSRWVTERFVMRPRSSRDVSIRSLTWSILEPRKASVRVIDVTTTPKPR